LNQLILPFQEYRQDLKTPQLFFLPAIDPFSITNKELTDDEVRERLNHYGIRTDLGATDEVRVRDQSQDGKADRSDDSGVGAVPSG
jgi:trehalose synthase